MSTCKHTGKVKHKTEGAAWAAARAAIADGLDSGLYVTVYRCVPGCWQYHWGHSGKLWGRAIRNAVRAGNVKSAVARRRR